MSHEVRWWRLVMYSVLLLALLLLPYLAAQTFVALRVRWLVQQQLNASAAARPATLASYQAAVQSLPDPNTATDDELQAFEQQWMRQAPNGTEASEEWRATVRSHIQNTQQQWTKWIVNMQASTNTPPCIQGSAMAGILEAILFPLGETTSLRVSPPNTMPYPCPVDLWRRA